MTFYFYDLETSGLSARWARIMQFGGVRTDENLEIIGDPYETFVKLTDEVIPEPDACLVTGITPQKANSEGISEVALAKHLMSEIFTDDTIVVGYNNIRFDDEFIRFLFYRNYYDPYEREWADGRSRWDLIDVVRMTRALRPEGIKWPTNAEGEPSNRLEELTKENGIEHEDAHDAMADVIATIEVAKLIKKAQPKLFEHLLSMRDKKIAGSLLDPINPKPIVHTSGMLSKDNMKTSVFYPLAKHPVNNNAVLVWDLRHDPAQFKDLDSKEIARLAFTPWRELAKNDEKRIPIKAIHLNKSPGIAPLGVLDEASQKRINLTIDQVEAHVASIKSLPDFGAKVNKAWGSESMPQAEDVDGQLYDSFISDGDKKKFAEIHRLSESDLREYTPRFNDQRLNDLWVRYKARNFASTLTDSERQVWEQFRSERMKSGPGLTLAQFGSRLAQLAQETDDEQKQFILQELQLYGESIVPFDNTQMFSDEEQVI